jgi:peptidoglycan/LPS O-acetylase OafA/YrhL
MYNKTPNTQPRVDFFDGLRGWAAVVVTLGHISGAMNGLGFGPIAHTPFRIFFDGGFAVYIFLFYLEQCFR